MSVRIKVTGSSSSGNNYIIESEDEILVLELGCDYQSILKTLEYNLGYRKVVGCLITHRHQDHYNKKTVAKFINGGVPVYSNHDVADENKDIIPLEKNSASIVGGFTIRPFELEHSVENYGYLISCPSGERIIFATDCTDIPYNFKNINIFMCEANYDMETVIDEVAGGENVVSGFQNHMNIEDTVDFLKRNYTANCLGVLLIHLSSTNSNEEAFISRIKEELGISSVEVAHSGQTYEYKEDF